MILKRRTFLAQLSASLAPVFSGCDRAATAQTQGDPKTAKTASSPERQPSLGQPAVPEDAASPPEPPPEQEREAASEPTPKPLHVYLQPLGEEYKSEEVNYIKGALQTFFQLEVSDLKARPLPREAYYPPRSRYRAEKLLDDLAAHMPEDAHVVIGLTLVDISTTKGPYEDWGILGLATISGGQCVISRFRAQRGAKDEIHTKERLAKVVVHEVGHTLGLEHCPNFGCLMEDGRGSVKTTDHEYDLCSDCRSQIAKFVVPADAAAIPWPKPSGS